MTYLRNVMGSSLVRSIVGLLAIAAAFLFLWPGLSSNLFALGFGADMFMPHGHCYLWVPSLVALHVSADVVIGISYTMISITLAYLVYRARRDIPFHWIFLAFGLFIVACGATHFMEVWTLWNATYWLSGYVKLITAAASLATAVVLPAIVPRTLVLVSDAKASKVRKGKLETINQELEKQIIERKEVEQQMRQATQTLHTIFQAAPLGIYAFDSEGKTTIWNAAAERIFGWSEQEAIGRLLPMVPEERREEFDNLRELSLQGQSFADMEVERQGKGGSVIKVSISMAPLRNAESEIVGVLGIAADITERELAQEAVRKSEERYRELVENASDIIYTHDLTGRFTSMNKAGEHISGYKREEFLQMNIADIVAPEYLEEARRRIAEKVAGGALSVYELEIIAKDGSRVALGINSRLLLDGSVVVGIQGIARDVTERKHAEEAVRASEARLAGILNIAEDGIISIDENQRVILYNQGAEKIFGYSEEAIKGQPIETLMPARFDVQHSQHVRDFSRSSEIARRMGERIEVYGRRKDGSEFPAEISISKFEQKGEIVFTAMVRDVTERKQRTEALKESERQLAAAQQVAQLGNWESDLITRTETWSEELYRILGLSSKEVTASWETFLECVHPDDRAGFRRITEQALEDYRPFTHECRLLRPDGTVRTLMTRVEFVRDKESKPVKLRGIAQDITERKQAEVERDTERRLLESLLDQLPVGVLVTNVEGRYVKANQKICEILGVRSNELIGMTAEEAARRVEQRRPEGIQHANEELPTKIALQTQRPASPAESIITTPGGKERRIVSNATPVMIDGGGLFGSVTVVTDMTEQYALQEQLQQSQKMESIGTLAGGVAHDFNNLLTAILGHTQLAMRKLAPAAPLQDHLIEVEKAGTRATALTRQLLAFSRRQRLERKTLDLNDTIRDIMKMLRRIIGEDIDLSVHGSMDVHPVFADPAQVEQVVMNLAVNARDAMPHGGQLVIGTRNVTLDEEYCREHAYAKPGKYVLMTVSDTGTGMNAETKERIFEPFFTTKAAGEGTGLGLAMVFGIVKQHEGLIEVYSEVGHGTTFKIYLPVDERAVNEESPEVLSPMRGGKETILVAEDEESLRGLARSILEELGYTVLLASDGAEAVDIYQANRAKVSLLVFDIVMPRMGGREAFELILEMGGDVPALFMTGYSAEIVQNQFVAQNQFLERTGSALLQKPYSFEIFGRKVRELLDQAKHRSNG